jgi:hypothetical protein
MDLPSPIAPHQFATFEERGVSVPFTTPTLAGARVRRDPRHGLVLVVPNPAGGRGVYVLPWSGVRDMCQPTLHDNMLYEQISHRKDRPISPGTVRASARRVAAEGAAGRAAHAAALQANRADIESGQATNQHLLRALAMQPAVQADLTEVATLAGMVDEIGIGPQSARASIPVRLAALQELHEEFAAWSLTGSDETGYVSMTCAMSTLTIRCADQVIAAARARVGDIGSLLAALRTRPGELAAVIGRPAWVLDGWDLPCLIWNAASGVAAQRTALLEIGQILTVLPREAGQWIGTSIDAEVSQTIRRTVAVNQDWRTGTSTLDVVARNEQFRALAA